MPQYLFDPKLLSKLAKKVGRSKKYIREQISKRASREGYTSPRAYFVVWLNPDLKLKQGYSITFDNLEQIIKDPKKVKVGQLIKTKFYKGHVFSQIKKK